MHIGIPVATKGDVPVRVFDRATLKALQQPDRYARKVTLEPGPPQALPIVRLNPEQEIPNRAERRRLVQKHVDQYFASHLEQFAHLSAKERKRRKAELFARVMHEAPRDAFARHDVERPKLIVPEVEVQGQGIPDPKPGEERSPGGIILP